MISDRKKQINRPARSKIMRLEELSTSRHTYSQSPDRLGGSLQKMILNHSAERFQNTFQGKKAGPFSNYEDSSLQNPLGGHRYSKPFKMTQSKKHVNSYLNKYQNDPIVHPNSYSKTIKVKCPPQVMLETKNLEQRKHLLPSERLEKPFVKRYDHMNHGFLTHHSVHAPNPEKAEYETSTKSLKHILQYSYAKHKTPFVTAKVSQLHKHT